MNLIPSLFVLLLFACLVAYEYIRDLRRENQRLRQENKTAWRLYELADNDLRVARGLPAHAEKFFPEKSAPKQPHGFQPGAIGRGAILARDFSHVSEVRDDDAIRRGERTPSTSEIAAAAREAVNGDGLD